MAWWDGRSPWLMEEIETLRDVAPGHRLAGAIVRRPVGSAPARPAPISASAYRHALRVTAATAAGLFLPMGFEYATRRPFDAARATPDDFGAPGKKSPCDLTEDVAEANDLLDRIAAQSVNGALRQLTASSASATALLRYDSLDPRDASRAALVLINPGPDRRRAPLPLHLDPLPPQAGAAFALTGAVGRAVPTPACPWRPAKCAS